jgi:hypothetical protein
VWTRSTVPWTESTGPIYGSIGFIKWWSLIIGSVFLISCIGSQMNDHELIRWGGGALVRRGRAHGGAPWLLTGDGGHGGYGAPFTMGFLPTALEWRGELVSLTLGRGDELYRVGDGGVLHSDLADIEEALRSTSGFKNGMRSLSASTSRSYAGSIAPCGSENRARWLPMVRRVPQLVGKNPSTIGRYL